MKKSVLVVVLLVAFAMPVAAQDIMVDITSIKGKYFEDGYYSSNATGGGCFDIYLRDQIGDTSYTFDAEFWDCDSESIFFAHGVIVFNYSETKAALQGSCSDDDYTYGFVDGTITCSRGNCKFAGRAGFNGAPDYNPYIWSLTTFSGFTY